MEYVFRDFLVHCDSAFFWVSNIMTPAYCASRGTSSKLVGKKANSIVYQKPAEGPEFYLSLFAGPSPRLPRLWAPEKRSVPERSGQMLEVEYGLENRGVDGCWIINWYECKTMCIFSCMIFLYLHISLS